MGASRRAKLSASGPYLPWCTKPATSMLSFTKMGRPKSGKSRGDAFSPALRFVQRLRIQLTHRIQAERLVIVLNASQKYSASSCAETRPLCALRTSSKARTAWYSGMKIPSRINIASAKTRFRGINLIVQLLAASASRRPFCRSPARAASFHGQTPPRPWRFPLRAPRR